MMVVGGLFAASALAVLVGLVVKALWNALMPGIFGLPEVGYWQAVGLLVLGHLLFGGGFQYEKHIPRKGRCTPCADPGHEDAPDA
jgi:hypothetical protein